ncbi:MAG: basic secretory protein-like protein [Verrucomicrobiota bacterium]
MIFSQPLRLTAAAAPIWCLLLSAACAEVTITPEHSRRGDSFKFETVPAPAVDDAAAGAIFKIIGGTADPNARNGPAVLHDGKIPTGDDDPAANFFLARDSEKGRLLIDLGKVIDVKSVDTYSWHQGGRAGQHYTLYAADGTGADFKAEPDAGTDPEKAGWRLIGKVDTAAKGPGQHGVEISGGKDATLGKNRYLLLETRPNEDPTGFGQTFWSEIDVIDAAAPEVKRVTVEKVLDTYQTDDGKYKFVVDSTKSPDLREWFGLKVVPEVKIWYPKIVEMIAVPGFASPTTFSLRLQEGTIIPGNRGIPAYASGGNIVVSSEFLRSQQKGEAVGCVIHEIVHIAQSSDWPRGRRRNVPTWVTEGVADYIRWFLFEPESNGAAIRSPDRAKYNASYRVTANFFDWVVRNHVKDLAQKLNATSSTGYNDGLWKEWTGKTVEELEADWKKSLAPR